MRLATTTFVISSLAALFVTSASAAQFPRPNARRVYKTSAARALAARQFKYRRDIVDTCISISGETFAVASNLAEPEAFADLSVCTCLNDVTAWLETSDGQAIVGLIGADDAATLVNNLLTVDVGTPGNPYAEECTLPTVGSRVCTVGSACAFECDPNYTAVDGACVCEAPLLECNAVCDDFPNGCSTQAPIPRKRQLEITTLAQAKLSCKRNESVCGVAGRKGTLDFECIDTSVTLDSCGGCITPHPFHEPYRSTVEGIECGRLPGVLSSGCANSQCVVSRCKEGQEPSADKTSCVLTPYLVQQYPRKGAASRLHIQRDDIPTDSEVVVTIDPTVVGEISALAQLVVDLSNGDASLPAPPADSSPIAIPIETTDLPIDSRLAQVVVQATVNLLGSNSAAAVLSNLDILVNVNALVTGALTNSEDDIEGLAAFIALLDQVGKAALDLKNTIDIDVDAVGTVNLGLDTILAELVAKLDVVAAISANAELNTKVEAFVKLVVDLKAQVLAAPGLPASLPSIPSPGLPNKNLLGGVVRATSSLLGSFTVEELVSKIDDLVNVSVALDTLLGGCHCVEALGLAEVKAGVDAVVEAAVAIQVLGASNTIVAPTEHIAIIANADVLIQALDVVPAVTST